MTRQEELREQYEDALFTLLMEEVAVAEGEEFLRESEALRGDPEAAVPEEVIRRCRRTINRCFSRQRRRSLARQFRWVFQKASVVALLGVLLFSAVYAISPEFRVGVLNLVVETLDESTDVSFGKEGTEEAASLQLEVGWVPEGFYTTETGASELRAWHYLSNGNGADVRIDLGFGNKQQSSLDTEDVSEVEINIGNLSGTIASKNEQLTLTLIDPVRSMILTIRATGVAANDLMLLAGNVKF